MSWEKATLLAPVAPSRRIVSLDILRGFALLGILLVNMLIFAYPFQRLPPFGFTGITDAGRAAEWFIRVFAEGSFYPVFSFLFGVGFGLQLNKGAGIIPVYRRRLWVLLAIGLLHGIFIWYGDILASYALVGFVLIAFRNQPDRRLGLAALAGWLLTIVLFVLPQAAGGNSMPVTAYTRLLAEGSYGAVTAQRALEFLSGLLAGIIVFGPQVLALFLLGLITGRRRIFEHAGDHESLLLRTLGFGLLLAAPFSLWYITDLTSGGRLGRWSFMLEYFVASPALGLAYLAALTLLLERPLWRRLLAPLSYVGRMALSNYLAQSLIGTLIFYGYGLGYYNETGPAAAVLLSITLFALQVIISRWWLQRFRFGPMEWLWRSLTYGRPQTIRKTEYGS